MTGFNYFMTFTPPPTFGGQTGFTPMGVFSSKNVLPNDNGSDLLTLLYYYPDEFSSGSNLFGIPLNTDGYLPLGGTNADYATVQAYPGAIPASTRTRFSSGIPIRLSSAEDDAIGGKGGERGKSVIIRCLTEADFSALKECWCSAFSDYQVPLQVSDEQLDVRLRQDSFVPELSFAAFDESGEMLGFWLSGVRLINGKRVAYDAGTAVIPDARSQGLSKMLSAKLWHELSIQGVDSYITEVFIDNEPAVAMYKKQGFEERRLLHGYRLDAAYQLTPIDDDRYSVEVVELASVKSIADELMDYVPSWQNSWEALSGVEDSTVTIVIKFEGEIVGFAITQPILKRIAQVGIANVGQQREVMSIILSEFRGMVGDDEAIKIVNIPDGDSRIPDLLRFNGFNHYGTLAEMLFSSISTSSEDSMVTTQGEIDEAAAVTDTFNGAQNFQIYLRSIPLWSSRFSQFLLDNMPIETAGTTLDIACGPGVPTIELAQRLGDSGTVVGVDKWGVAIEHGRRVAEEMGLQNVTFMESDVCQMPFDCESFTTAVSVLGISNFEAPEAALREANRVLQRNASIHIVTNLVGHMQEFYDVYKEVLMEMGMEHYLPKLDEHIQHRPTLAKLARLLERSGFAAVKIKESSFKLVYASGSDFLRNEFINYGFVPAWRSIIDREREAVFKRLEFNLNELARQHGHLTLTIPMAYVEARKVSK